MNLFSVDKGEEAISFKSVVEELIFQLLGKAACYLQI